MNTYGKVKGAYGPSLLAELEGSSKPSGLAKLKELEECNEQQH